MSFLCCLHNGIISSPHREPRLLFGVLDCGEVVQVGLSGSEFDFLGIIHDLFIGSYYLFIVFCPFLSEKCDRIDPRKWKGF